MCKIIEVSIPIWVSSSETAFTFLVCVEEVHRRYDFDTKVPSQKVELLNPILDEEGMAHDIIDKVVLHAEIVHPVDRRATVPRVVDAAVALI